MIHRAPVKLDRPDYPTTAKVGGRVLRAGDIVKVTGQRGAMFRIHHFEQETRGMVAVVYGGASGKRLTRAFPVETIGTRKAMAGSTFAEAWS